MKKDGPEKSAGMTKRTLVPFLKSFTLLVISQKVSITLKSVKKSKILTPTVIVASKNELIEMSDLNITACMQSVGIDLYQEMLLLVTIAGCNCGKDSCPIFESRVFSSRT